MIHLRVISSPTFDIELLPTLERYTSGLSRHRSKIVRAFYISKIHLGKPFSLHHYSFLIKVKLFPPR